MVDWLPPDEFACEVEGYVKWITINDFGEGATQREKGYHYHNVRIYEGCCVG